MKWRVVSEKTDTVDLIITTNLTTNTFTSATEIKNLLSSYTGRWTGLEEFNYGDNDRINGAMAFDGDKIRLLKYSELASITDHSTTSIESITNVPGWLTEDLSTTQGYWIGQHTSGTSTQAYAIYGNGQMKAVSDYTSLGIRPVIRVKRSNVE